MCAREFPDVIRIVNESNLGFNVGNNQGMRVAQGEYVLLLNNDTIVLPGAIEKLVEFLDVHPDVGVAGPKLLNPDGSLQRSCNHFPSVGRTLSNAFLLHKVFPHTKLFGGVQMTYWNYDDTRTVDWLMGACMLVRMSTIQDVGLLDESSKVGGDYEWCWRFWKHGWKVVFVHDAAIVHIGGKSSISADGPNAIEKRADALYQNYETLYFFWRKHYGLFYARLIAYIQKIGATLRLVLTVGLLRYISHRSETGGNIELLAKKKGYRRILNTPIKHLEDAWSTKLIS